MLLAFELEESTGGETGWENVPFIWAMQTLPLRQAYIISWTGLDVCFSFQMCYRFLLCLVQVTVKMDLWVTGTFF